MVHEYFVYILTNKSRTLYVGMTNDLVRRIYEHKNKLLHGFTSRYKISQLVYYEMFSDVNDAITHEKRIKGWLRQKKIDLINSFNPQWNDLSEQILGTEE